jgi:hypothetical protein
MEQPSRRERKRVAEDFRASLAEPRASASDELRALAERMSVEQGLSPSGDSEKKRRQ